MIVVIFHFCCSISFWWCKLLFYCTMCMYTVSFVHHLSEFCIAQSTITISIKSCKDFIYLFFWQIFWQFFHLSLYWMFIDVHVHWCSLMQRIKMRIEIYKILNNLCLNYCYKYGCVMFIIMHLESKKLHIPL